MEIIAAVKARDTEKVKALLKQDPSLVRTTTDEGSLLLTAIFYGAREAAKLIHALRDDLTVFEAATCGDLERLGVLLGEQPDLANAHGPGGMRALHLAAYFGHKEAVALLLDSGAEVSAFSEQVQTNIPRNTALHAALAGGAQAVAELLIERGADVQVQDSSGWAPLHHAAYGGYVGLVRLLLERGATVNPVDGKGQTPLAKAESRQHSEVAELLRAHGGQA